MYTFLIVVIAIIGLLLTLLVLLQSGKGGGLAGIAAGGTTQLLGARTAPDILEKGTWVLATAFIILCMLTNFFIGEGDAPDSVIQSGSETEQVIPTLPPVDVDPGASEGAGESGGSAPASSGTDESSGDQN